MGSQHPSPRFNLTTLAIEEFVPCQRGCPVFTDAGRYVQLISERNYRDAYLVARNANPLVEICGQVCAAPCEDHCRRGQVFTSPGPALLQRHTRYHFLWRKRSHRKRPARSARPVAVSLLTAFALPSAAPLSTSVFCRFRDFGPGVFQTFPGLGRGVRAP